DRALQAPEVGVGVVEDPVMHRADALALAPAAEGAPAEMAEDGRGDVQNAALPAQAQQQVGVLEPEPEALVEAPHPLELAPAREQRRRRRLGDGLHALLV